MRAALGLSLILFLAGCLADTGGQGGVPVLRKAVLAEGVVGVQPPPGYCIDARSLSDRPGAGFALIGSCATLTGGASGAQVEPAIITISVSPAGEGEAALDSTAFQTALGRGRILRAVNREGLNMLQVQGGARIPPSADETHWRGLMVLKGHVLGLALYGAKDSAVTGDQGMRLMIDLAEAIRRASGGS